MYHNTSRDNFYYYFHTVKIVCYKILLHIDNVQVFMQNMMSLVAKKVDEPQIFRGFPTVK
jgi:hypothetical protein